MEAVEETEGVRGLDETGLGIITRVMNHALASTSNGVSSMVSNASMRCFRPPITYTIQYLLYSHTQQDNFWQVTHRKYIRRAWTELNLMGEWIYFQFSDIIVLMSSQ